MEVIWNTHRRLRLLWSLLNQLPIKNHPRHDTCSLIPGCASVFGLKRARGFGRLSCGAYMIFGCGISDLGLVVLVGFILYGALDSRAACVGPVC